MSFSRRTLLKASAASAVLGGIGAPFVARAQTAEFTYKYANNLPDGHPMNARAKEMAAAIKAETNGRFDLQIFPNNQLGSDTDLLSQIRSGGVEFFTLSGLILSTLVPAASISGIGFAFPDYDTVWKAMDGDLGAYIRGEIAKADLVVMDKIWDNGFRQITSSTQADQRPTTSRASRSACRSRRSGPRMFKAFDAAPASINFNEVYSALQTKIVEGQENPLAIISTAKLYEVQKYCSLTNHMWDGFWFLANRRAWEKLPEDVRDHRRQEHQRRRRQGARGHRQAECRPAAGTGRQGPDLQPARRDAVPRQAPLRRLLRGMEGQIRRRGLGAAGKVRRQAVVSSVDEEDASWLRCRRLSRHADDRRGGSGPSPPLAAGVDRTLRWARWSRSRRRCWSSPRSWSCLPAWSRATCLHRPLIWSDELASILFLWLAMLGAVVAFRRGEHMRMTALVGSARPAHAGLSRRWSRSPPRWPSCC